MSGPVHYLTVTSPDGEVMGYVWADGADVGWADRKASSVDAYKAGMEWYGAKVRAARERGVAPLDILGLLGREPGVGPVTAAPDVAAVEALAKVVTPADDARLVAALDRDDAAAWRRLGDAYDALTDEDRDVQWGGGETNAKGVTQIPYPRYSPALLKAVSALRNVVLTTEYRWSANPLPELPPDGRLSTADAIRAAMALVLGERISEGMIDEALKSGLLDAAVASLRAWYETAPAHRTTQHTTPHTAQPASHDTGNTITTPPPPQQSQPLASSNPYDQQPVPQPGQPQYGMPPAPQGMSPQPYGYPQQAQPQYGYPPQGQPPYGYPQQGGQHYGMPQAGPHGAQPHLACRFCGGMPAAQVTFRAHQGFLILMRFQKYDGPMCGNCGTAVYRTMMTATLWQGWWSPFSLFIFTPFTVIWNLLARGKVGKLPHPAPGQHRQQADPGKPVHQRPLAYVALIPVLWICFLIFQGIAQA